MSSLSPARNCREIINRFDLLYLSVLRIDIFFFVLRFRAVEA